MTPTSLPARPASTTVRRFVRQLHRWIGLLVGVQVLLWVTGGVVMSVLKLDEVRGEHMAAKHAAPPLDAAGLRPLAEVLRPGENATSVTLTTLLGAPVYRIESAAATRLADARSGAALSPLPAERAQAVAQAGYAGPGTLLAVEWVDTPGTEYRGRDLPLWRVRFDDPRETTLYVSPATGQIVARRNDLWRVFDFVWMLHIMDYEEREDFNHPLLVVTAITALLFVLTGAVMLFFSFRPRAQRT